MSLKITKAAEPIAVERLNLCIYAQPGIGKTSLAFTADAPLLLDFDQGAHRAANRKDVVRVAHWGDVASISADDLAPYRTVIVDTAGRALDTLTADIIRRNPKAGRGGALTLQGYGTLKAEFVAWLKLLNSLGKDVILIAHMDEQRNGDEIIERLDVQGGSKGEIYKAADAMGRIAIREGTRVLNFSPTDAAFGKNPGQLDPLPIPHKDAPEFADFLAGVVQQIKDRLNTLTEDQRAAQAQTDEWRIAIEGYASVEEFNTALPEVKDQSVAVKALFNRAAEARGYRFDKKAGEYRAPEQEAA
ncbi:ATP-binding protein [Rhodanobacter glycinis]|uniref:ATP-binding protein n=1 Tax=Rhodanobacter glycinis TaxID=582702 RepID=A0A5B9DX03_9GAMM|nr:ATP-binding protein [Rhodanobacter glycinis]QEE24553.1 ATP-binding protein [Rhodanobacter glycinis]